MDLREIHSDCCLVSAQTLRLTTLRQLFLVFTGTNVTEQHVIGCAELTQLIAWKEF